MVNINRLFKKDKDDDDVGVVFHKDLVEGIGNLRFSYGETPTADTAH